MCRICPRASSVGRDLAISFPSWGRRDSARVSGKRRSEVGYFVVGCAGQNLWVAVDFKFVDTMIDRRFSADAMMAGGKIIRSRA